MMTIRDVARVAGVSVATVSRVLNHSPLVSAETREAVMRAVTQLDYHPNANAQALATQVSDTIGVVVMDVSDPFFGALVKAVDGVARRHHKYVLIGNSYHDAAEERHAIEVFIRQRCSALIVHAKSLSDAELSDYLRQVPGMIVINRIVPGFEHRSVGLDNVSGAALATRTLLTSGHRRIGYLASDHGIEDDTQRCTGWRQAMAGAGIEAPENWSAAGSPDMQGGEAAMVELLGRNLHLDAVFAYNDSMAVGALTALKDNGIAVPAHFSVIGFDDMPGARYADPQLTTVRYPITSMGTLAAELALAGAAGRLDAHASHCFMPTLVRRHSVYQSQADTQ
ncbi:HTH-type transcriptional regulator GalS [Erwinia sp. HR93]|uniref:HTH-type transcriptional regulator GalS n=1 Tax=Erwinia sp. HR93 TaxID=3094840 RepID=UPI002ADEEF39|nr:HTH-type transcriptional regulator GalS [Erwinia sp. HR93]MEA1065479.1 HTH-type transcriptional regulator GalS [Erwinia sp. HR93]